MLDLGPPGHTPVASMLPIAPEVRESVLSDLAFSPAGDTLWVLAGDTPRSAAVGPQPTELRAMRLASDPRTLVNLDRLAHWSSSATPRRPAGSEVGRALPLASGAAIRLPPERNTRLLRGGVARRGGGAARRRSDVFRVGAEDAATTVIAGPARLGRPDISPEGRWLLAPAAAPDGAVRVLAAPIDGRPAPRRLGPADRRARRRRPASCRPRRARRPSSGSSPEDGARPGAGPRPGRRLPRLHGARGAAPGPLGLGEEPPRRRGRGGCARRRRGGRRAGRLARRRGRVARASPASTSRSSRRTSPILRRSSHLWRGANVSMRFTIR